MDRYKEIKFFYSPIYFILLTAVTYVCWYFDMAYVGFSVLGIAFGVTTALCRDPAPTVIFPFIFTLTLYKTYMNEYALYLYGAAIAVLLAGFIIHLVRFKPFKTSGKAHFFTFGALALFIAIALSGLTVPDRPVLLILAIAGLMLILSLQLIVFGASIGRDDRGRARSLLLLAVVMASMLAAAEFITHLFRLGFSEFFANKNLPGETAANQYANLIARSLPVFFYLSVKKRKGSFLWLLPAFVTIGVIALTNSRATILMTAIMVLIAFIVCMVKSEQKVAYLITFLVLVAAACSVFFIKKDLVQKIFAVVIDRGLKDYHRFELWEMGWKKFLQYPIFGIGLADQIGYGIEGPMSASFVPFWYHNTFVQTLASFGAVGGVGLVLFLVGMFYTAFSAKDRRAYTAGCILLFILAVSMLDIHFYTPQTLWQLTVLTIPCYRYFPRKGKKS